MVCPNFVEIYVATASSLFTVNAFVRDASASSTRWSSGFERLNVGGQCRLSSQRTVDHVCTAFLEFALVQGSLRPSTKPQA